jgi:hypothetical protein
MSSGILRFDDSVNDKLMSQYTSILVGQTYLIAGNSLEPFVPKSDNQMDWTISSEALVIRNVQRLSKGYL